MLYVFVYTPLKTSDDAQYGGRGRPRRLASGDRLGGRDRPAGRGSLGLFLIVFLWQFPHFLAIAWIYRDDYRRAGFRMLTAADARGTRTGRQAVSYALVLVPVGTIAGDGRPGRAGLFRRSPLVGPRVSGRRPLDSGWRPVTVGHAGCSLRRLFTCPRS